MSDILEKISSLNGKPDAEVTPLLLNVGAKLIKDAGNNNNALWRVEVAPGLFYYVKSIRQV